MRLAAPSLEYSPPKPIGNGSAGEMAGIIQEVPNKHIRKYDRDVQTSSTSHGVSRVGEGDARKDCSIW